MASIQTSITITHAKEAIQTIKDKFLRPATKPREESVALMGLMNALSGGDRDGKLVVQINSGDAVKASGTVTITAMVAADTVTIGGVVFTGIASGATGNQFNIGGTDTITAANLAAVVNANVALAQTISATSALTVVTVTSKVPGKIGNFITLAISAHGTVSAATLASGADATTYSTLNTYHLGV